MANFLNRIAIRGAGAHSPARPSTIAPPILPGRAPLPDAGPLSDQPDHPSMPPPTEQSRTTPAGTGQRPVAPSPAVDSNAPTIPSTGQPDPTSAVTTPSSQQAAPEASPAAPRVGPQ